VLQPHDNQDFIHQVRHVINNDLDLQVISSCLHLLSVGLFQLETSIHRDILLAGNIYDIDRVQVRFIRHDHNRNQSEHPYTMFGWIMMLGFLLDYISLKHIDQTMASFGKLVSWHNNPRALGSVLIKCLYNGAHSVPKSPVFRQGDRNGSGWSWNVPVYVLNWEHSNDIPPPPRLMTSHQNQQWVHQHLQNQ
jgi:hypothetical protein